MKCLVTGGGGFIGSAIVTKLVEQGHNVVVMGRFNRPHCIATEIANQVEIIQGDIRDLEFVNNSFKNIDYNDQEKLFDLISKLKVIYEDFWKDQNLINTSIKLSLTIRDRKSVV